MTTPAEMINQITAAVPAMCAEVERLRTELEGSKREARHLLDALRTTNAAMSQVVADRDALRLLLGRPS